MIVVEEKHPENKTILRRFGQNQMIGSCAIITSKMKLNIKMLAHLCVLVRFHLTVHENDDLTSSI